MLFVVVQLNTEIVQMWDVQIARFLTEFLGSVSVQWCGVCGVVPTRVCSHRHL